MALPLARPKHRQQEHGSAARFANVAALHVWGVRIPAGLLAVWLWAGPSLLSAVIIVLACTLMGLVLQRQDRLNELLHHELLHWRAQRIRATWPAVAQDLNLSRRKRPRLWIRQSPTGLAVTFRPKGSEHEKMIAYAADGLVTSWKAMTVTHRPLPRGRYRYDVTYRNALSEPIPYPAVIESTRTAVPFGIDEHGRQVTLPLWNGHLLMAGTSGAGKSWTLHTILAGLAALPDTAFVLIDPKRVELAHWRQRATTVATDIASMDSVLEASVKLVRDRFKAMEKTSKAHPHGRQLLEPSPEDPHVILVIEELAILMGFGTAAEKTQRKSWLKELALSARAASVSILGVTQQPNAETIPTDIRGQMTRKIALATATWDESKMILGDNPAPAHLISFAQQGTAYVQADGSRRALLARAYMLDGDQAAAVATKTAHLRVDPGVIGLG